MIEYHNCRGRLIQMVEPYPIYDREDDDKIIGYTNIMRQNKTIRVTIDLPMDFPEEWDNEMIEFHLNESSYCCSNLIREIEKYSEENGCICMITKCSVID